MKFPYRRYIKSLIPYAFIGGILAVFYMVWLMNETPIQGKVVPFVFLYLWAFFGLTAYFTWTRFLASRLAPYSLRFKLLWGGGSLIAGFWLAANIPVILPGGGMVKGVYFLGTGSGLGVVLFTLTAFLVTRFRPPNPPVKRRLRWLVFALPIIEAWVICLLAFWPGMMSADSLDQWGQVLTGQFNDHHPAFHTFTIWLLTRIVQSPAIVALAQIVALGLVAGVVFAYIESMGVSSTWVWIACLAFALSPVNGTMVVTLWKDIPYSTVMLGFTYLILRLARSKGEWIARMGNGLLMGVTAALAALFRHNGLEVAVGSIPILLLGFLRQWKSFVLVMLVSLALYFGMTGPVYQMVGVTKSNDLLQATTSLYTLAANANPGSQVDQVFRNLQPFSGNWLCSAIMPTLDQASQRDGVAPNEGLLVKAQNLISHAPTLIAYDYRCNRSLVWIIWDPNGEVRNPSHAEYWIDPNPYGITPDSKLPGLLILLSNFVVATAHNPNINWLVWRPALYLYLFLLVVVIAAMRRKNFWILFIAVPILLQSIGFMLIPTAPNFRYHYFAYLLALAFWPIIFVPSKISEEVDTPAESTSI